MHHRIMQCQLSVAGLGERCWSALLVLAWKGQLSVAGPQVVVQG